MIEENLFYAVNNAIKNTLRYAAKQIRDQISPERRLAAKRQMTAYLLPRLEPFSHILSFVSFGSEIEMGSINSALAHQHRLLLPRSKKDTLSPLLVTNLNTELEQGRYGILEPSEKHCQLWPIGKIDCILVPGLLFDSEGNRLGYGKGHYDRLLFHVPEKTRKWGIGFREQLYPDLLPRDPHDIPLDVIILL